LHRQLTAMGVRNYEEMLERSRRLNTDLEQ
jgi:hypothetical protein